MRATARTDGRGVLVVHFWVIASLLIAFGLRAEANPVPGKVGRAVHEALALQPAVRVLIVLGDTGEDPASLTERQRVARVQDAMLSRLRPGDFELRRRMSLLPVLAGDLSREGLRRLASAPEVRRVDLDAGGRGGLAQAVPLTNTDDVHALGVTGAGVTVAVLDSGIDSDHPDLGSDLAAEACFCSGGGGCCPGLVPTRFGPGSAEDDNGHGSNVTGIVTSNGVVTSVGTAPGAGIVAIKVLDSNNSFCCSSDIVAALDWIANTRPDVDVVNMSLGTFAMFFGDCDEATSYTLALSLAVNRLRDNGVLSFVSSGNTRSTTQMQAPACVASSISVAAVYDANVGPVSIFGCADTTTAADKLTCFSNRNEATDILAPGAPITSWSRFGGSSTYYGTSQASPHAAGCAANLLQAFPGLTPALLESALESTGRPVADPVTGRVYPRVDCLAALQQVACTDQDMDGFPSSALCLSGPVDCDDADPSRYPGNPEICDGRDNDCDGVTPPGELAAPGAITGLRVDALQIDWDPAGLASDYDLVRGSLDSLHASAGDFAAATLGCLANAQPATGFPLPAGPPVPGGDWYLVRGSSCFGAGTFDSGFPSQMGGRDAGIAASGASCP